MSAHSEFTNILAEQAAATRDPSAEASSVNTAEEVGGEVARGAADAAPNDTQPEGGSAASTPDGEAISLEVTQDKAAELTARAEADKKRREEYKARKEQQKAKQTVQPSDAIPYQDLARIARAKPLELLKELGVDKEELIATLAGFAEAEPAKQVDPEVERLQTEAQRWQQQAIKSEVERHTALLKATLDRSDKYPAASYFGQRAVDLAFEVQQEYFREHQQHLANDDALALVEEHFTEQVKAERERLEAYDRRTGKHPAQPQKKAPSKTLPTSAGTPNPPRKLSPKEEFAAILGALK